MKNRLLLAALLCATPYAHAGCGSSFCSVNTHWDTQGLSHDEGLRLDLRYSYARADTPRTGSRRVAKPLPTDPALAGAEVENLRTINQTLNLDLDYAINRQWRVALDLPLVMRDHSHMIGAAAAPFAVEQKSFNQLGDIRVVGSYAFASDDHFSGGGLRFGVKLPTGSSNLEMVPGKLMERALQPGSGSTDAVLGAYYHHREADAPWGWFTSVQMQSALTSKNAYLPGNDFTLDVGVHYALTPALTGLLQLNAHLKERDGGLNSNPHSGGHSLNLSPGVSYAVSPLTSVYGFVQLPLYQYANPDPTGLPYGQLTAPWSVSVGISHSY